MTALLPHVQCDTPEIPIKIDRVCVKGFYRRICLDTGDGSFCLNAKINACIDLPRHQRGIHVSRSVEAIIESLGEIKLSGLKKIEEALRNITKILLDKHKYAYEAEVSINTLYLYKYNDSYVGINSDEIPIILMFRNRLWRDGKEETSIGVKIKGMTVCPCAQQVYAAMENLKIPHAPSHSQRATILASIKTNHGSDVDLNKVIKAVLESFSAPVLNLLKRDSEYRLVKKAFENPRFVEDVTRHAAYNIFKECNSELNDDDEIQVRVTSFESIHPFNLYASSSYKVSELKEAHKVFEEEDIAYKSC